MNGDAVTLCLSRQFAMLEGRNQQAAMIATARRLRMTTTNEETYSSLGLFITATPRERQIMVGITERNLLKLFRENDNA